jgi:hypothetical protein
VRVRPRQPESLSTGLLARAMRHRQTQLLFTRNVQHPVIILDDVTHGLQVPLDEAGDDLPLKTAVLALLNDPLADDEFQSNSLFAHVTPSAAASCMITSF